MHPTNDTNTPGSATPAAAQARVLPLRGVGGTAPNRTSDASPGSSSATPAASRARPAAPAGWTRAPQCGWCLLGDDHPALLAELHAQHLRRGLGARSLAALAARRLEDEVPSARALSRHLSRHLDRVAHEVQDDEAEGPRPGGPGGPELAALWALHLRLERRIEQLDEALAVSSEPDLNRIAQLAGLANAERSTLLAIAKLRESPNVIKGAMQRVVKLAMTAYSAAIITELVGVTELADRTGAFQVAARFRAVTGPGGPIVRGGVAAAESAIAQTLRELGAEVS